MIVKELVSKCDMNCTVQLNSLERGYLFSFGVGKFKAMVDEEDIFFNATPDTDPTTRFREYFSYIGFAGKEVKDFYIRTESGYVFPVIEIYI